VFELFFFPTHYTPIKVSNTLLRVYRRRRRLVRWSRSIHNAYTYIEFIGLSLIFIRYARILLLL
jgi:hypothetical protein